MINTKLVVIGILLVVFSSIVYSAKNDPRATVDVDISGDGGSTYSHSVSKSVLCGSGDSIYYAFHDLTGDGWTGENVTDANFANRVECISELNGGKCRIGLLQGAVYYTQEANLEYEDPTPANNSYITGYQFVNASSDKVITDCIIAHNSSGYWINRSASIWDDGMGCTGELYDLTNASTVYYSLIGYTTTWSPVHYRIAIVNSTEPILTEHSPISGTDFSNFEVLFNYTKADPDNDYGMDKIYIGRTPDAIDLLVYRSFNNNGTYNFTLNNSVLPLNSTLDGLYAQYRLDCDESIGDVCYNSRSVEFSEHYPHITDTSGNGYTGTLDNSLTTSTPTFNESGKIAGAFEFDGDSDWFKVGNGTEFNDICDNGCTYSLWIYSYEVSNLLSYYALGRYRATDYDRLFMLYLTPIYASNVSNRPAFSIYKNGSNTADTRCHAVSTSYPGNTTIVPMNEWHHLVGGWNDELNKTFIYLDGNLEAETNCSFDEIDWDGKEVNTFIGASYHATYDWDGMLDDISMFNRTLTHEEIVNLYNHTYGKYFYNITTTDYNINRSGNFTITLPTAGCTYDCSLNQFITTAVDCSNTPLILQNSGSITFQEGITNINGSPYYQRDTGCLAGFWKGYNVTR